MNIRAATEADAMAVASLYIASRRRNLALAPLAHHDVEVQSWICQSLIPSGRVVVATQADEIVAMMATSVQDRAGWIDQLYVAPGRTGRGYGSALVEFAKQILPWPIQLYSFQANHGARRFYERLGFVPVRFTDGTHNEEHCPDILFRFSAKSVSQSLADPSACTS